MNLWNETPGYFDEAPNITYFPATEKKTDAAIVIFPGGGYTHLADHEGTGFAEHFNSIGMDAFVVRYRVKTADFPLSDLFPLPLLDARRAVRWVRYHAEKYQINPNKIITIGSSAGGHLNGMLSNYRKPIDFEGQDEIDALDYVPNYQIFCYSVLTSDPQIGSPTCCNRLMGGNQAAYEEISSEKLVSDQTPPAFLWSTSNDPVVNVCNTYLYASALRMHNIEHEVHIFPVGKHGLGLGAKAPHVAQWVPLCKAWLVSLGVFEQN